MSDFGKYLRKLRKSKDITLRDLAEDIGTSHSYLSQIERGERNPPKPDFIRMLSEGLSTPYIHLMEAAGYIEDSSNNKEIKEFEEERGYDQIKELSVLLSDDLASYIETDEGESKMFRISAHLHGHELKTEERERLLKVAELMFPHYSNNN